MKRTSLETICEECKIEGGTWKSLSTGDLLATGKTEMIKLGQKILSCHLTYCCSSRAIANCLLCKRNVTFSKHEASTLLQTKINIFNPNGYIPNFKKI